MTLAQMRLWLREGERLKRIETVRTARAFRSAFHAEGDSFENMIKRLED